MKRDIVIRTWLVLLFLIGLTQLTAQTKVATAHHLTWSVIYDYDHMAPQVVWYILDESDFRGSISTKTKYFKMDTKLPPPRVNQKALQKTGYERGHLCPAGDRDARKDWLKDTYYTSNVVLMTTATNAGAWRDTELLCRRLAVGGHRLLIACGPVWYQSTAVSITDTRLIFVGNTKKVATQKPPYLFKVCCCLLHPDEMICWLVPNENAWLNEKECRTSFEALRDSAHIDVLKNFGSWKSQ